MNDVMIKIDSVSKIYTLGQIGGTSLRDELQRRKAKRKGLDDPTKKIGSKTYQVGEKFKALDNVSFEVKRGERIGIIGHNGAGKSTLLKLLSRVTAPTSGEIGLNGRIASMLEVGTGFHPELTGRENIYMNGAILGMTKSEIDRKMEDIIEFSECRQFIDTPVKRYSSGMSVKLAFSVAAHLDSEIMIMDEVLAVGDMAFQRKCLDKMNDVSRSNGRTILYVSHNMSTIRQLCDRVIVLDHGQIVFDGCVEDGIGLYLGRKKQISTINYSSDQHEKGYNNAMVFKSLKVMENDSNVFFADEKIKVKISISSKISADDVHVRMIVKNILGIPIGMAVTDEAFSVTEGDQEIKTSLEINCLAQGNYYVRLVLYSINEYGTGVAYDVIDESFSFSVSDRINDNNNMQWNSNVWGYTRFPSIQILYD